MEWFTEENILVILVALLSVVEAARRVAETITGKPVGELGVVSKWLRKAVDFLAGRSHGEAGDPSAIKRE